MNYCKHLDCGITPVFNYPQFLGKGKYCKGHSLEGMIDVRNQTCEIDDCRTRPHFNLPGTNKGIRCSKHSDVGMINVITLKCRERNVNQLLLTTFTVKRNVCIVPNMQKMG